MNDFRIWGRIEHTAPNEFAVIVTTMPESAEAKSISVINVVRRSRPEAELALQQMMIEAGKEIAYRGDRVVDTEVDGL